MTEWTSFDVHGLVSVQVSRAAPAEPQLRLMLALFEVGRSDVTPVVTVTGRPVSPAAAAYAETAYRYDTGDVHLPWATVTRTGHG
ncbi:hypothetical protein Lesp02_06270 [Lentzea sp. NBRC 105346]|uniref:hypothetical protein n=1 Tax=Lentzea sp. NBRC 105346 TaxID=3032205 RepID=UPI0024A381A4|nr:hypothetical protein [Lentzea sp. NBRC 105346]GLZ28437.1 hypothetical protein Lesp02_06270 [Lentzea sp. NBRC 105346]